MSDLNELMESLGRTYEIREINHRRMGHSSFKVEHDHVVRMLKELRDVAGYSHLVFLTCTDWIERGSFTLTYMLHNYQSRHTLAVHTDIDRVASEMESIHKLWAQAATYQQELREMYGIEFPHSPRLHENFCLEGWDQVPPMRKEFDTAAFSLERFHSRDGRGSEDPRAHMKAFLYPTHNDDDADQGESKDV